MRVTMMLVCLLMLGACATVKSTPPADNLELKLAEAEVALTQFKYSEALSALEAWDKASDAIEKPTPVESVALGWQSERAAEIRFVAELFAENADDEKLAQYYAADPDAMFERFAGDGTTLDSPACYRLYVISGKDAQAERGFQRMLKLVADEPIKCFRLNMLKATTLIGLGDMGGRAAFEAAQAEFKNLPLAKVEDLPEYGSYCLLPPLMLARADDFAGALGKINEQLVADPEHPIKARLERFATAFKELLNEWPQEQARIIAEDALPRVEFETEAGRMVITLFEDEAPNTVASFIELVESGFYDGLKFHRIVPHFVTQGGDPDGTGSGGPGYSIKRELGRKHFRGYLGMARSADPDSAGSQFYFCLSAASTHHLDAGYAVFGRISEGIEVMDKLRLGSKIIKAKVLNKQPHDYKVEKLPEKE